MNQTIENVVILGGGTAGWMTAAALSRSLSKINVTLVESEQIGTIGVGEATIPTIQFFNGLVGISPNDFVRATRGSYKLGINFENWHEQGKEYFHAFGSTGQSLWSTAFHDFWCKAQHLGVAEDFGRYNYESVAAKAGKFNVSKGGLNWAFHLDSSLYAKLLRDIAEKNAVKRVEGKVESVQLNENSGFIESLTLQCGKQIKGDLFVDCSGFRSLLLGEKMQVPFIDWSHWLPCDRAIAVQTESVSDPVPYTRSIAHHSGWQWRIPLQHRMGNGIVYCSQYMSDKEAEELLLNSVDGKLLTTPRPIRFKTGYRQQLWHKNCVAIGLSGGFIEPLESTAIHLIQQGVIRLIKLFPSSGIEQLDIDEYNLSAQLDYEQIRDFIVLHYHQTQRDDSEFWRYCRDMTIPESLRHRMELFRRTGRFIQRQEELFVDSWMQVMIGQGVVPEKYHRVVDEMSETDLRNFLRNIAQGHQQNCQNLPTHKQYLDRFCQAETKG